jgi:hypothetical protein
MDNEYDIDITQYYPNDKLLDTVLENTDLKHLKVNDDGKVKFSEDYLKGKHKRIYKSEIEDILDFLKPIETGKSLDAQLQTELVQYEIEKSNEELQNLLQGTPYLDEKTNEMKYKEGLNQHYKYLFSVIRPKLILIKRLKTLAQQSKIFNSYHSNNQDLIQYLVHLINEAENDLKKFLKHQNLLYGLKLPNNERQTLLKSLI